jgi:AcrR family transcriptional regulator
MMGPRRNADERVRDASRTRRESARTSARQAILGAASELLTAEGYEALSLRRVAERAGYTATTIYRHFPDKDALLYAVTEEGFRLLTARLASAGGEPDPFASLEAVALAYIDFGLEHPVYYGVMFVSRPDQLWRRQPDQPGSRMDRFSSLRGAVAAALATRQSMESDVLTVSNALWAITHGVVSLALAIPHLPARQVRAFGTLGVRAFLRGIRSGP